MNDKEFKEKVNIDIFSRRLIKDLKKNEELVIKFLELWWNKDDLWYFNTNWRMNVIDEEKLISNIEDILGCPILVL